MSTEHTLGKLQAHHDHGWLVISDHSEDVYLKVAKGLGSSSDKALARRMVACWNLLLPFEIEEIESGIDLAELKNQRDELLEALKKIANIEENLDGADWGSIDEAWVAVHTAISKVEGGKSK